jgi:hypothetical protein
VVIVHLLEQIILEVVVAVVIHLQVMEVQE